jgi:hypothetical protein
MTVHVQNPPTVPLSKPVTDWSLSDRSQRPTFPQRSPTQTPLAAAGTGPAQTTLLPSIRTGSVPFGLGSPQRVPLTSQEVVTYLTRLMPVTVQIAVFADDGTYGQWCQHIDHTDTAMGRALYRMAARLVCAGLQMAHLRPLLQLQLQCW